MTIASNIVKHGTEAVLEYRRMTGTDQDNRVPEVFLGGSIARGLYCDLGCQAHVERHYTTIAIELGKQSDPKLIESLGGWRADVALYEGGRPKAVIEIKKYDEGGNDALVRRDLAKMQLLAAGTALQIFLAVLVTDTRQRDACDRVRPLGESLGRAFDELGPVQVANEGKANWSWLFACGVFA